MLKYIIVTHIVGAAFLAGSVSGCATDQDELDQQTDPASAESTADLGSGSPPVTSAGCGAVLDPSTPGGEAHWTITCGPNFAIIDGWVRDNRADNMCAWVKAFNDTTGEQMLPHAKACPKGTTTHFNWTTYGTNAIRAYLYIQ